MVSRRRCCCKEESSQSSVRVAGSCSLSVPVIATGIARWGAYLEFGFDGSDAGASEDAVSTANDEAWNIFDANTNGWSTSFRVKEVFSSGVFFSSITVPPLAFHAVGFDVHRSFPPPNDFISSQAISRYVEHRAVFLIPMISTSGGSPSTLRNLYRTNRAEIDLSTIPSNNAIYSHPPASSIGFGYPFIITIPNNIWDSWELSYGFISEAEFNNFGSIIDSGLEDKTSGGSLPTLPIDNTNFDTTTHTYTIDLDPILDVSPTEAYLLILARVPESTIEKIDPAEVTIPSEGSSYATSFGPPGVVDVATFGSNKVIFGSASTDSEHLFIDSWACVLSFELTTEVESASGSSIIPETHTANFSSSTGLERDKIFVGTFFVPGGFGTGRFHEYTVSMEASSSPGGYSVFIEYHRYDIDEENPDPNRYIHNRFEVPVGEGTDYEELEDLFGIPDLFLGTLGTGPTIDFLHDGVQNEDPSQGDEDAIIRFTFSNIQTG